MSTANRRPLASRRLSLFQRLAGLLSEWGLSPNAISTMGLVFGIGSGVALFLTHGQAGFSPRWAWLAAALLIQLRLLCNLLDGMVAIEGGRRSPLGELFNEVPDRLADAATLIGAGYAAGSTPWLGFSATVAAVFIAYLRALGAEVTKRHAFHGPMAKPHRMFTITMACLILGLAPTIGPLFGTRFTLIELALILILAGGAVTIIRRLHAISRWLTSQPPPATHGD